MGNRISFPTVMKTAAVVSLACTVIFGLLHRAFSAGWLLYAAISAGTTFYHFAMRLLVGFLVPLCV